jgi:RecA-family ATPase
VPEGLTILGGKGKLGKSWLALAWALVAAEDGEVLYLALEDGPKRLQDRIKKLMDADPRPPAQWGRPLKNLTLVPANGWTQTDKGLAAGLEKVGQWLDQHPKARLVVIDTFARFRGKQRKKADYQSENTEVGDVQRLAIKHGIGIIAIVHTTKGKRDDVFDDIQGSVGLTAPADTLMVLQRSRGTSRGELWITSRDGEEKSFPAAFDGCQWTFTACQEPEPLRPRLPSKKQRASDWLAAQLATGDAVPIQTLRERAADNHAWETVEDAKRGMQDVETVRRHGEYCWRLEDGTDGTPTACA